jgi:hypothetical protein
MDLTRFMTEQTVFLADLSLAFKLMEGDVPEQDKAWVSVRQATQDDNIKRSDLLSKREVKYGRKDSSDNSVDSVSDVLDDNQPRRRMLEAFWTLTNVGNLDRGDKPWFKAMPAKTKMQQNEFEKAWGELHPTVAAAISAAVLEVNPDWNQARQGE